MVNGGLINNINIMEIKLNNVQLQFVKYEEIEYKQPKFVGQTRMLDGNRNITFWFVQEDNKYYACIG